MPEDLRFMSVNAQRSGVHTPELQGDNRLPALCDSILKERPSLVGFQEAHDWAKDGAVLLSEVEDRIGLTAVPEAFAPDRSTGLMYDADLMTLVEWEPALEEGLGFGGTALFDVGLPFHLSVIVVHLSHQSAPLALHQASVINHRARRVVDRRQPPGALRGEAAVVFGDFNVPRLWHPADPAEPLPNEVSAANLALRYSGRRGAETVNREVAEFLERCRWTDLALHLAEQSSAPEDQARLLAPTSVHGGFAVDRVYLSESVVPAAGQFRQVQIPSDHRALVWEVAPDRIDPSLTTRRHV